MEILRGIFWFRRNLVKYLGPTLSKYLAGFRRNHNTQHALLRMIESWRALQN